MYRLRETGQEQPDIGRSRGWVTPSRTGQVDGLDGLVVLMVEVVFVSDGCIAQVIVSDTHCLF